MERNRGFRHEDNVRKPNFMRRIIDNALDEPEVGLRLWDIDGVPIISGSPREVYTVVAREAFAERYFKEQGWDITSPTPEQVRQLQSQPGWEYPPGIDDEPRLDIVNR